MSVAPAELQEVDNYLADRHKTLVVPQPDWYCAAGYDEHQLRWTVREGSGIERSHLRFRIPLSNPDFPSLSLILNIRNTQRIITRLDWVPSGERKANPPEASKLGLPSQINGPHIHSWWDNRGLIQQTGFWDRLPCRRPVTPRMQGLKKMFFWFCNEVSVSIPDEARELNLPDKTLFGGHHD